MVSKHDIQLFPRAHHKITTAKNSDSDAAV